MEYTITRNNNIFTIVNLNGAIVHVTVYVKKICNIDDWEVLIPDQLVTSTTIITLPNVDGLYKIETYYENKDIIFEELIIPIYNNLLVSFVNEVKEVLCGCACKDCDDCDKNQSEYLSVILKMLSYNIITLGIYNQYLTLTNNCIRCNILDINQCNLLNETILGNSDNKLLMKQLISYYYLVYLYTDIRLSNNPILIKEKYKYNEIISCIKKLGINEDCIKTTILGQPTGIFTFEFNSIFN